MTLRERGYGLCRCVSALAAALFVVAVLPCGAAAADAPSVGIGSAAPAVDPEARLLYEEGLRRYKLGAYDEAIEKLTASYARVPAPGLLYDLAQAHRLKGDCAGALTFYRRYLASPTPGAVRPLAEARAAEMEACAKTQSAGPGSSPVAAKSGDASLPVIDRLALSTASPAPPDASLIVTGGSDAANGRSPNARHRRAVWASGIATAVLAATTGAFALRSAEKSDQVSSTFRPGNTWNAAAMDAQSSGQTSQTFALVAGAATLIAGAITAWLLVTDR